MEPDFSRNRLRNTKHKNHRSRLGDRRNSRFCIKSLWLCPQPANRRLWNRIRRDWIDAAERSIGEVIGDQDIDLLQGVCRLRTARKVLPRRLTLSLGQANQLDAPSSRERSGAHHIGCLTGLLNRDPRPVVFEQELRGQWINGLVTDETCA